MSTLPLLGAERDFSRLFLQITVSYSVKLCHPLLALPLGTFSAKDVPVHVNCTEGFKDEAWDLQT